MKNNIKSRLIGLLIVGYVSLNFNLKVFISIVNPVSDAAAESVQGEKGKLASSLPLPSTTQSEETAKAATPTPSRSYSVGANPASIATDVARRSISTRDLVQIKDMDGLSVSPNGRWYAFKMWSADPDANTYQSGWYVAPLDGNAPPRNLASSKEPLFVEYEPGKRSGEFTAGRSLWTADSHHLLVRLPMLDGRIALCSINILTGENVPIYNGPGDVEDFAITLDDALLVQVTDFRERRELESAELKHNGYRFDQNVFPVFSELPIIPSTGVNLDILRISIDGKNARSASKEERELFRRLTHVSSAVGDDAAMSFEPFGSGAVWLDYATPTKRGWKAPAQLFVTLSPENSRTLKCSASECVGRFDDGFWWRPGHPEIVFIRGEGVNRQTRSIYKWVIGSQKVRLIARTDDLLEDCKPSRRNLVCFHEASTRPRTTVAIDLDSGKFHTLFNPNQEFEHIALSPVRKIVWTEPAGASTHGHLVLPANYEMSQRYPLVMVGYRSKGFLRGGSPGDEFPIQVLAANGFAVLSFDVGEDQEVTETATSVGEGFQRINERNRGRARELALLKAIVAQLDREGLIDPDRVALLGLSHGAELVFYSLLNWPSLSAAIASGPTWDPIIYYLFPFQTQQMYTQMGLGVPLNPRYEQTWAMSAFAPYASRVQAPLLINAADREYIGTLQAVAALRDAHKPVDMYIYPDEYHVKWQPSHRLAIYQRNVDWLNFWLRDVEVPTTRNVGDYAHWRNLRSKQLKLSAAP